MDVVLVALGSFLAQYAATKALDVPADFSINRIKAHFGKTSIEYQLLDCLEKSLERTQEHLGWERDPGAIAETFVASPLAVKTILSEEKLSAIFKTPLSMK